MDLNQLALFVRVVEAGSFTAAATRLDLPKSSVSRGIAGLTEVSFEIEPGRRGQGGGARLAADALSILPEGQLALAAVAPGNTASVRALLSAGFVPLGSCQLFSRAG